MLRKTLLAATILALPLAAQAQPLTGLYIAAGAGANWHSRSSGDLAIQDPNNAASVTVIPARIDTSMGFVGLASMGWGFGNGLRVEGEASYRTNAVNDIIFRGTASVRSFGYDVTGRISTFAMMGNELYDFRLGPVMPYIGGGVGIAWQRYSRVGFTKPSDTGDLSDTQAGFAYQGIAGLALPIAAVPGLALTAEYRYFASLRTTVDGTYTNGRGTFGAMTIRVPNENRSILVGVRYNFGRPVVAAPVAVAPAPARSFIVFFDFDRADLTARARKIIAQAAQSAQSQQVTQIEVAGHADRSGSDRYNLGLSQRRANSVAGELVRLGVARGAISVAAFGESRPLVPTADGVREPQNRRVEIVLR